MGNPTPDEPLEELRSANQRIVKKGLAQLGLTLWN